MPITAIRAVPSLSFASFQFPIFLSTSGLGGIRRGNFRGDLPPRLWKSAAR